MARCDATVRGALRIGPGGDGVTGVVAYERVGCI